MAANSELDKDRPSDLQRRLDVMAELEQVELEGHHVESLIEKVDPTESKTIAHQLEGLNPERQGIPPQFGFDRFSTLKARNRRTNRGIIGRTNSLGGRNAGLRGRVKPR